MRLHRVLPRRSRILGWLGVVVALPLAALAADTARKGATTTALDRYIAQPDASFAWRKVADWRDDAGVAYALEFTSQTWLTPAEVDRPEWKHTLTIIKPANVNTSTALLYISGGSNPRGRAETPRAPSREFVELAKASRSVVIELRMIPNQPLVFGGDGQERKEDDTIAYTWKKYLETGDERWPLRLPMTKAAVRAMDAATQFLATEEGGKFALEKFVVAGASKRGWTTWTTAIVDRRVVAICPIVIDVLNVQESFRHHYQAYGFYAPSVGDYVRSGVVDWNGTPEASALYAIEDPWSYRDRLTFPKLLVNACGDQFFLPDSSQFYFNALPGVKYLRYVPNTDHSMKGSDAMQTLRAWHEAIVRELPLPKLTWEHRTPGEVTVNVDARPTNVLLWQATNPKARDFRLESLGPAWTSTPLQPENGGYQARIEVPAAGWRAYVVELTFDIGASVPLKLTTDVTVIPDTLPFAAPSVEKPQGFMTRGK